MGLTLSLSVPLTSSGAGGGDWRSPGADSCSGAATAAAAAANTAALQQSGTAAKSREFKLILQVESQKRQVTVPALWETVEVS